MTSTFTRTETRPWGDVSSGSLGQGLPIAPGIGLADRSRNVWVVSTDGEMAEGSMSEAFRIASEQKLHNLRLFINANGFGAYGPVEIGPMILRIGFLMLSKYDRLYLGPPRR